MHTITTCAILAASAAHDAATLLFHDCRLDGTPAAEAGDIACQFKTNVWRGTGLRSPADRAIFTECWQWNAHIAGDDRTFAVPGLIDCVPPPSDDVFASF